MELSELTAYIQGVSNHTNHPQYNYIVYTQGKLLPCTQTDECSNVSHVDMGIPRD